MKSIKANTLTRKRALDIALALKFDGLPHDLDSISISDARPELQKAANRFPHSETFRVALEVLDAAVSKQRNRENKNDGPRALQPDDPPISSQPGVFSNWEKRSAFEIRS